MDIILALLFLLILFGIIPYILLFFGLYIPIFLLSVSLTLINSPLFWIAVVGLLIYKGCYKVED